jgi:hypothetical protein
MKLLLLRLGFVLSLFAYLTLSGFARSGIITTTADTNNNSIRESPLVVPVVTTAAITSVTQTAAAGGGDVTSDSSPLVIAKGVCWSAFSNPTLSDMCTSNGVGTGAFISSIFGLTANTTYHVRAYATNSVGTAYGKDVPFTTLKAPDFQIDTSSGGSYSAAVTAGSNAIYKLAVTGINGFSGSVSFTFSGLPAAASCSINPSRLDVRGSSPAPFTVTISAAAHNNAICSPKIWRSLPPISFISVIVLFISILLLTACTQKRKCLSFALLSLCTVGLVGCGDNKTSSTQSNTAVTHSIILTATSDSISHNANLTLIVH